MVKSQKALRLMPSLLSAEELLVLIPNTILVLISSTLLMLVCINLLWYILIVLEVKLHVFSQLAWLLFSTRNFSLWFQLVLIFQWTMRVFTVPLSASAISIYNWNLVLKRITTQISTKACFVYFAPAKSLLNQEDFQTDQK